MLFRPPTCTMIPLLLQRGDTESPRNWLETFTPFGLTHMLAAAVSIGVIVVVSAVGRAWAGSPQGRMLTRGIAVFALAYWVSLNAWWNWPGGAPFDITDALPLHICDIGGLIGPLALLTQLRWLRATLYFWAFALTTQGFFTPVVEVGPAYIEFWAFWLTHGLIVLCAVYDLTAHGFRPTSRDLALAYACSLAYAAVIFPLNIALHTNYGYIGNLKPQNPTLIDKLGPWPIRVVYMAGLVLIAFTVVYLPWPIYRVLARQRTDSPAPPR